MYDLQELSDVLESALAPIKQIPQSIKEMGDSLKSLFQGLTKAIESMASKFIDALQTAALGYGASFKRGLGGVLGMPARYRASLFTTAPGSITGYSGYASRRTQWLDQYRTHVGRPRLAGLLSHISNLNQLGKNPPLSQFGMLDKLFDLGHQTKGQSSQFWKQKAGMVGIGALGSLAGALVLATTAAIAFADKMRATATGLAQGGGTLANYGSLRMLQGLGLDGAKAQSFGSLLNQGGLAAGLAARIGIRPYGGLGGDQNSILKLATAVKHIVNSPNDQEAGIYARAFGLEDISFARYASKESKSRLLSDYGSMSSSDMRAAADAQIDYYLAMRDLSQVASDIGRKVLPMLTFGLKNFAQIMMPLAGILLGGRVGGIYGAITGGLLGFGLSGIFDKKGNLEKAVNSNSNALNRNTQAIDTLTNMQNGIYGGGQRLNSAIPAAWGPLQIENQTRGLGIMLGAYSV